MDKINNKKTFVFFDEKVIKSLIIIISYFVYLNFFGSILKTLNLDNYINNNLLSFIADLCYLIIIISIYYNFLKEDFNNLKKALFENIVKVGKWFLIIIILQLLSVTAISSFLTNGLNSSNEVAIMQLPIYLIIFKTMIFSVIVEELIFKKTVHNIISNNTLFLIVSSLLYGFANVIFTKIGSPIILMETIPYIVISVATGILYIKSNNLGLVMLVKFTYNIIPLMVVFMGVK